MLNERFDPRLNPAQPPIGFWMQQEQEADLRGWEPQLWKKGEYQIKRESYNYFVPSYHANKKVIELDVRDSLEKAMMACSDHKYERKV